MPEAGDRRRSLRQRERFSFTLHYAREHLRLTSLDVSSTGALLESPHAFPSGTTLVLEYFSGSPGEAGIRLMCRVVRSAQGFGQSSTARRLGVAWLKIYTLGEPGALKDFLSRVMRVSQQELSHCVSEQAGQWVFSPSGSTPAMQRPEASPADIAAAANKVAALQRGRYRFRAPVLFSVDNVHCRGQIVAIGPTGVCVKTEGTLPYTLARVTLRMPLGDGPRSAKVLLFAECEATAPGGLGIPGFFSARIIGIDELDSPGSFRNFLRELPKSSPLWMDSNLSGS